MKRILPNKIALTLMVTPLLLMSCTSSPINLTKERSVAEDEGTVFGRVKVIKDNKEVVNFFSLTQGNICSLILLPDGSSKGIYHTLEGEGYFYWHLPRGGYSIVGFEMYNGATKGQIFAHFNVPKDNAVTYIGTLGIRLVGDKYTIFIEDDYDLAVTAFRKKYPEMKREFSKDLIRMEARR